ncbi:hypothetical protein [Methanococcoides sp. NM1]|uniref:hypothetical protein n=1 Tax=Methanococcoides sp. NM1 TaxID=1201013 RepID=UPI001084442E|nr:hypothetical protein [Methanococcoides sp. NM1]
MVKKLPVPIMMMITINLSADKFKYETANVFKEAISLVWVHKRGMKQTVSGLVVIIQGLIALVCEVFIEDSGHVVT